MGYYINPPNMSKEEFLEKNAVPVSRLEVLTFDYSKNLDLLPVCLIDSGFFTAAGILYNRGELGAFVRFDDSRSRKFWLILTDRLGTQAGLDETDQKRLKELRQT